MSLMKKIFGDYSSKEVKRIRPICDKVLALDEEYSALTDEQLQAKTPEFKRGWPTAKPLMIFCRRPLPPAAKLQKEL